MRFSPIENKKLEDIKYNINLYDDDKTYDGILKLSWNYKQITKLS